MPLAGREFDEIRGPERLWQLLVRMGRVLPALEVLHDANQLRLLGL